MKRLGFIGVLMLLVATVQSHTDITLTYSNGKLTALPVLNLADAREVDLSGTGTVWATDNPGFAGSGFRFQDEFHFDIVTPLIRWNGDSWSSVHVGLETIKMFEPSPLGPPVKIVTIGGNTSFIQGFLIQKANPLGSVHQHDVFELSATDNAVPREGAYSFGMVLRSPQYGHTEPVRVVFNNGLEEGGFQAAAAIVPPSLVEITEEAGIQVAVSSGELQVMMVDQDHGYTLAPQHCLLKVRHSSKVVGPEGTRWLVNGEAGSTLRLGFDGTGVSTGEFEDDELSFAITSFEGPGSFFAMEEGGAGQLLASETGSDVQGMIPVPVGQVDHHLLGFTASGTYRIGLQVCGRVPGEGTTLCSNETILKFEVCDMSLVLAGKSSGGAVLRWPTEMGASYQLQKATAVQGPWMDEGPETQGNGSAAQAELPWTSGSGVFYRIKETFP